MRKLLYSFEEKAPEIVFEWNDTETEAVGWVVINSLRGGAAGGGTRMRKGLNKWEVVSLAKTMEVKFTVSGPQIGGAKSGINFDPNDPRKHGVIQRWYKAVMPLLKHYYGTGGDLNIDEIRDVIPITEGYGLWHPQEGVVNGHYSPTESQKVHKIGQLRSGVSKVVEDPNYTPNSKHKYTVADLITGYGVAVSVLHYYTLWNQQLKGKRILIQGWGNVGAAAGYFLSSMGAIITGILDLRGVVLASDGLSADEVNEIFSHGLGVYNELQQFEEAEKLFWEQPAEVFVPAAGSRMVSRRNINTLIDNGLELLASGANVPFADDNIFYGPLQEEVDQKIALIPDFIANCGMARVFAYLMEDDADVTDEAIFNDVSRTILRALEDVNYKSQDTSGITARALEVALQKIKNKESELIL